jgi:hypothetical protein
MRQWVLAGAFVIAGLPFGGLGLAGIRYANREHASGRLPSWYGWIFGAASFVVFVLFLLCALRVAGRGPSWRALWIASLVSLPLVVLATYASPQIAIGMLVLLLAIWALRRRTLSESG